MVLNANQLMLRRMLSITYAGMELPSQKEAVINGKLFTVSYHFANRKCFDGMPTPTVQFKIDGKRVSRKDAFAALEMLKVEEV